MLALIIRARAHQEPDTVAVMPPSALGSLGDEAMVWGLLRLLDGRDIVAVRYTEADGFAKLLSAADSPVLLSKLGGLEMLATFARAGQFYVIGADTLDGRYSDHRTKLRIRAANLAARCGVDTSIVCFSMSTAPTSSARKALAGLHPDVRLVARDPLSAERASRLVDREVRTAADLAFLGEAAEPRRHLTLPGKITIGFVPNYLFAEMLGGPEAYVDVVSACLAALLESDDRFGVVIIPHDTRGSPSDYRLARSIAARLPADRVAKATSVAQPGHVRWLSAQLDLLLSCRMHAAIGALGEGVPTAVFGYQDKAEGVFGMFDLEDWVIDPSIIRQPDRFVELAHSLLSSADQVRVQIRERLPGVLAAAGQTVHS